MLITIVEAALIAFILRKHDFLVLLFLFRFLFAQWVLKGYSDLEEKVTSESFELGGYTWYVCQINTMLDPFLISPL